MNERPAKSSHQPQHATTEEASRPSIPDPSFSLLYACLDRPGWIPPPQRARRGRGVAGPIQAPLCVFPRRPCRSERAFAKPEIRERPMPLPATPCRASLGLAPSFKRARVVYASYAVVGFQSRSL